MDVKYLNYVLAIAGRRNMTKAAEDLFVSQSSLSQYISRLEQELGTPLFFRNKSDLSLTPAGELYVEAARKVIKIQKELYQNIDSLNRRGHITVGVTSNFGLRMLSEIIPQFKEQYPEFAIEITETNLPGLKKLLMEEALDLGIAAEVSQIPFENQTQVLRHEEVFFAIPRVHPYAQEHPTGIITVKELVAHFSQDNFLLSKKGSSLRLLSDQVFDSCGFSPSAFCETNSITATRNMIAQNAGVAFIGESCSVDREHIAYYSMSPVLYRMNVVIHRKSWVQNEPEQLFMKFILDYFVQNKEQPYMAENYALTRLP